jgi:hypothetical protein
MKSFGSDGMKLYEQQNKSHIDDYFGTKSVIAALLKMELITPQEFEKCLEELDKSYLNRRLER